MAWVLRLRHKVPYGKRQEYLKRMKEVLSELDESGIAKVLGSYKTAFGDSKEFTHLIEYESLARYEEMHLPPQHVPFHFNRHWHKLGYVLLGL